MALKYQLLEIMVTSGNSARSLEVLNKIIFNIEKNYWGNALN